LQRPVTCVEREFVVFEFAANARQRELRSRLIVFGQVCRQLHRPLCVHYGALQIVLALACE
jgi:hypothetical protein